MAKGSSYYRLMQLMENVGDIMRNPESVLNSLTEHSTQTNYKFERLYRVLFNEEMFYMAYQRIYAKQGNMTEGSDGKTIDEMSLARIEKLIGSLRDETYQPNPARRTYIPKKNGKMRPLGIPKLVSYYLVLQMVLGMFFTKLISVKNIINQQKIIMT